MLHSFISSLHLKVKAHSHYHYCCCHYCESLLFAAVNSRQVTSLVFCIFGDIVIIPFAQAAITVALEPEMHLCNR